MKKIFTIIILLISVLTVKAQDKNAKYTLYVDGICEMCKKRIEKASLNSKGVKYANWNLTNKQLTLIINENKTNINTVSKNIADAGHDTEHAKAPKEVYDNLHFCCKYREN